MVLDLIREQIGRHFQEFQPEIIEHLNTVRAHEKHVLEDEKYHAQNTDNLATVDIQNHSELRYFTDANHASIFERKLTKASERRRMTHLYAKHKTQAAQNDSEEAEQSGNFIEKWISKKKMNKTHRKNFEHIIDRLRESSALWKRGDRAKCLVRLQSVCIEFGEVEVWLPTALSDSSRWSSLETNTNIRECMQILVLQEACFALFSDTMCMDSKVNEQLQVRRSIRNMLSVGRVLQFFSMDFLRVAYYARLAMSLKDQGPAMQSLLDRARHIQDPFVAATMFVYYFEVRLRSFKPMEGELDELGEVELCQQSVCDKKCHLVSYYGHMSYSRIRKMLRRHRRHEAERHQQHQSEAQRRERAQTDVSGAIGVLALDSSPAHRGRPHHQNPSSTSNAQLTRQNTTIIPALQRLAGSPKLDRRASISSSVSSHAMFDMDASKHLEDLSTPDGIAQIEADLRDRSHTTCLVDVQLLHSPIDQTRDRRISDAVVVPFMVDSGTGPKIRSNTSFGSTGNGNRPKGMSEHLEEADRATSSNNSTTSSPHSSVYDLNVTTTSRRRNLMEEIRTAVQRDYVWKIRTLWDEFNIGINDSPITTHLGLGGRRMEFKIIDGRRAAAGDDFDRQKPLTQSARYATTTGCTILHAAILNYAHKIMQWALRNNADCFVRHSATGHTALAMLQHNTSRSKSARERCEKAMQSIPVMALNNCRFGCGDIETFLFLSKCKKFRPVVEAWLAMLESGQTVDSIVKEDKDEEERLQKKEAEEEQNNNSNNEDDGNKDDKDIQSETSDAQQQPKVEAEDPQQPALPTADSVGKTPTSANTTTTDVAVSAVVDTNTQQDANVPANGDNNTDPEIPNTE